MMESPRQTIEEWLSSRAIVDKKRLSLSEDAILKITRDPRSGIAEVLGLQLEDHHINELQSLLQGPAVNTPEKVTGPGFPWGSIHVDPSLAAEIPHIESFIENLGLDRIYNTCCHLTGFEPYRRPLNIELITDEHRSASLSTPHTFASFYHPQNKRIKLSSYSSEPPETIKISYAYGKKNHEEMRGIIYHELGHLWTQKIFTATDSNEPYCEAFAEMMRTAAARFECQDWQEAYGGRDAEFLLPTGKPLLIPSTAVPLARNINKASSALLCNDLRNMLGDDPRTLGKIAKACSYSDQNRQSVPLEKILLDIERETGIREFARGCYTNPDTTPGNIRVGPFGVAFLNTAGNKYCIIHSSVLNEGIEYNWSKKQYPEDIREVPMSDMYTSPVREEFQPFTLAIEHEGTDLRMDLQTTGSLLISPQRILTLGEANGRTFPPGSYRLTFIAPGYEPVPLRQKIIVPSKN